MKFKFLIKISFFLLATVLLTNCSKEEIIPEDVEINDFVWGGMNAFYKFQGDIEDLADTNFSNRNELNEYLASFETPEDLFNSVLAQNDSFSQITDDFTIFEDELEGYITTNGLEVQITEYTAFVDPDTITGNYAYVFNVLEDSDADIKGITPGMLFTHVNGTVITAANFETLFSTDDLILTEGEFDTNTGTLIANANFSISATPFLPNAIASEKIISEGDKEIGYFVYNHFGESFVDELNALFEAFRTNNVTDLIIDLRFNTGTGSTETATYLGSMITGQFTDELFSKQIWNEKVMSNINNNNLATFFTDEIEYDNGTFENINSLGLEEVYFIVSNETNAASLLLINSLEAYIDVILVGEQTGNNHLVTSILYDSDDYTKEGENFNTTHTYAIKPIVFEVQNNNNTNNANGYVPNLEIDEDPLNVFALGDQNETLLAATIGEIMDTNTSPKASVSKSTTSGNKTNASSANSNGMIFSF